METINDRLHQIVNAYFNGIQRDFAQHIGLPPGSISNYLNKGSKPGGDVLEKIVKTLNVDANWLLTGTGEMERKKVATEKKVTNAEIMELCRKLADNYHEIDMTMAKLVSMINTLK